MFSQGEHYKPLGLLDKKGISVKWRTWGGRSIGKLHNVACLGEVWGSVLEELGVLVCGDSGVLYQKRWGKKSSTLKVRKDREVQRKSGTQFY